MWDYCEHLHAINIKENQRDVQRKLYSSDLRDEATSEEMAAHVEDFSQTVMQARLAGIKLSSLERASLFMESIPWTVMLGLVRPRVMLATGHMMARTPLEIEHQRLGPIDVDRLLELARAGRLKERYKTYRNVPFEAGDCEACLSAKITRYPKEGDAPKLAGGSEGVGFEVDITGPFSVSTDGYQHLFGCEG